MLKRAAGAYRFPSCRGVLPIRRGRLAASLLLVFALATALLAGCAWLNHITGDSMGQSQRLTRRAQKAEKDGASRQAASLLSQAVQANPDNPEAHRQLARLLLERKKTAAALPHLRTVAALSPHDPWAWIHLAEARFGQGEKRLAKQALARALKIAPDDPDALLLKGKLYEEMGHPAQARQTYHRILQSNPEHNAARLRLAGLLLRDGEADQAAPLLRSICRCSQITPKQRTEAEWLLGIAYGHEGRWNEAAASLQTALKKKPNSAKAAEWYRLAYAFYQAGKPAEARQAGSAALAQDPQHPGAEALLAALPAEGGVRQAGHTMAIPAPKGW